MAGSNAALDAFNKKMAENNLHGQWLADAALEAAGDGPTPAGVPYLWPYDEVHAHLIEACDVLPETFTARRHLSFSNPGLERGTSHTLHMGVQLIRPGETAWSHRHTIDALRFVIEGDPALHTVVDGEICPMQDYDLIRTPNGCWHDHTNGSGHDVSWIDIVDSPILGALNQGFYETLGEARQPARNEPSIGTGARMRPVWEEADGAPPRASYRYGWADTYARLKDMAHMAGSPFDGIAMEYINPETGGPTFDRYTCWAQMLRPGEETRRHRHTSSALYFVIDGEGSTVVGDTELAWKKHDSFVVPNWSWHRHINRSPGDEALLFSVNDAPILRAANLYREQAE